MSGSKGFLPLLATVVLGLGMGMTTFAATPVYRERGACLHFFLPIQL